MQDTQQGSGRRLQEQIESGRLSLVLVVALGLAGLWGVQSSRVGAVNSVTRSAMVVDMMHDGIRADVLAERLADQQGDTAAARNARADLAEHVATMSQAWNDVKGSTLASSTVELKATVAPALERYMTLAKAAADDTAATPAERAKSFDAFYKQFKRLETDLGEFGGAVERDVNRRFADADGRANRALLIGLLFLAFTVGAQIYVMRLMRRIRRSVAERSGEVLEGSQGVLSASDRLRAAASSTAERAASVSDAAQGVSAGVGTVAATVEQLTSAISHVAESASEVMAVANEAVDQATVARGTVDQLRVSSERIGEVVDLISSIAQQTNLLALNATIEAARAGTAGRGFAVVANEVKELAHQTAEATTQITAQIEQIRTDSRQAAEAIDQIGTVIGRISEAQSTVAAAVEEQHLSTVEIARAMADAARGADEIATSVSDIAAFSSDSAGQVDQVHESANGLRDVADHLRVLVG